MLASPGPISASSDVAHRSSSANNPGSVIVYNETYSFLSWVENYTFNLIHHGAPREQATSSDQLSPLLVASWVAVLVRRATLSVNTWVDLVHLRLQHSRLTRKPTYFHHCIPPTMFACYLLDMTRSTTLVKIPTEQLFAHIYLVASIQSQPSCPHTHDLVVGSRPSG